MATARASITGLDALDFRRRGETLMDKVEAAMDDALEKGERAMKDMVATRGTGKEWTRPWGRNGRTGSFPGRVDTGDMQAEIRGKVTEKTRDRVVGNLGWDEDSADYIAYQDQGFRHVLTGQYVEGMRALRDGGEIAKNALVSDLNDIAGSL